ncbi:MAG: NAD(P)H-quinone oxidoreductase [Acidobacteria bacterium]|nr:NAD(P)H-quinone oxidoreductase [Acidobacteriota bacterium]
MICVEISRPGDAGVLREVERPDPVPGAGEVLIRVAAAGVNRPDLLQRRGRYPPPPGASDIPGLEVAGTVASVGSLVREWRPGDAVCALVSGGGYAGLCVAPAVQCLPVPRGLDAVAAAAIPETFFTVWANLFELGRLQPGETALVHGGAGGIGTTAIQLASVRGATVFATAGTDERCRACERLGAARAINHRAEDFARAVAGATSGRGVDLILDHIGGGYTPRNLASLAPGGRLVQIGAMQGSTTEIDLRPIIARHLTLTGSALRPRSVEEKGRLAQALREHVWPLLESGRVKPIVFRTFPLAEAAEAHRLMEAGGHIGKIILLV